MYSYSVDPTNIPAHLSNPQLEYFILFGILVAGKNAKQTHKKLDDFLERNATDEHFGEVIVPTPFEIINRLIYLGELAVELEASRFGQYSRIVPAIHNAVALDVDHLTVEALENVPGIGPKTSRYIMLYSDPSFEGVPLDTHILKFLATIYKDVPKSTPAAGKRYEELESRFQWAASLRHMTVRELDTEVWKAYSSGNGFEALTILCGI